MGNKSRFATLGESLEALKAHKTRVFYSVFNNAPEAPKRPLDARYHEVQLPKQPGLAQGTESAHICSIALRRVQR